MTDFASSLNLIAPIMTLVGVIVGAVFGHILTRRRDQSQKRREIKLTYLIEAWRNIYIGSQNDIEIERKAPALERGITDVMLFGSAEQIRMASVIAQDIVAKGSSDTT